MRPAILLMLLVAGPVAAQNLVVNGGFDHDLSGWLIDGSLTAPAWSPLDKDGRRGSGSLHLRHTPADGPGRIFPLVQCIPLRKPGRYRISGHGHIPPDQGGGHLVVGFWLSFDNPGCPRFQGVEKIGGHFLVSTGGWTRFDELIELALPRPVPRNAMLRISLGIDRRAGSPLFEGYFDAISITPDLIFAVEPD